MKRTFPEAAPAHDDPAQRALRTLTSRVIYAGVLLAALLAVTAITWTAATRTRAESGATVAFRVFTPADTQFRSFHGAADAVVRVAKGQMPLENAAPMLVAQCSVLVLLLIPAARTFTLLAWSVLSRDWAYAGICALVLAGLCAGLVGWIS